MRLKHIKKIIYILTVLLFVLIQAGCGGSSGTSASSTQTASPESSETAGASGGIQIKKLEVPRKFESNENTPAFFMEALKKKEPILVAFYNEDDSISKEILAEIKVVYDKYNGSATFLQLKPDLNEQTSILAEQLQVHFTPYVAVLNREGTIIFEKTGYVDSKIIEQAVYDAVNK